MGLLREEGDAVVRLLLGDDEAGLRLPPLKPGQARGPKRLVPWWVRGERRVSAAQRHAAGCRRAAATAAGGRKLRSAARAIRTPQRGQSLVPAQRRQGRLGQACPLSGARTGPARTWARLGFDACPQRLDLAGIVREWERSDS